MTVTKKGIGG